MRQNKFIDEYIGQLKDITEHPERYIIKCEKTNYNNSADVEFKKYTPLLYDGFYHTMDEAINKAVLAYTLEESEVPTTSTRSIYGFGDPFSIISGTIGQVNVYPSTTRVYKSEITRWAYNSWKFTKIGSEAKDGPSESNTRKAYSSWLKKQVRSGETPPSQKQIEEEPKKRYNYCVCEINGGKCKLFCYVVDGKPYSLRYKKDIFENTSGFTPVCKTCHKLIRFVYALYDPEYETRNKRMIKNVEEEKDHRLTRFNFDECDSDIQLQSAHIVREHTLDKNITTKTDNFVQNNIDIETIVKAIEKMNEDANIRNNLLVNSLNAIVESLNKLNASPFDGKSPLPDFGQ
jgi:hypothetical protein